MPDRNQVLFVDDDPMVLNGLKRLMRPLRDAWDARFAEGGEQAIAMLEDRPADVVVSDMRMPGMNGAELLTCVMARWPETVRFVLSGYADSELISQCVGASHQFMAKPCDPEQMKSLISRAVEVRKRVHSPAILRVVGGMTCLPSPPEIYHRLSKELHAKEPSVESVGVIIAQDPALSAKMLQIVNSAFFGLSRNIDSPVDAVVQLGVETCRSLALALGVYSETPDRGCAGLSDIWDHSLRTAIAAEAICVVEEADKDIRSKAYAAGLLMDCGQLVLATNFPDVHSEIRTMAADGGSDLCRLEWDRLEASHPEIGGHLLSIWGLPVEIVEAVVLHHQPEASVEQGFGALVAVHVADHLVREIGNGGSRTDLKGGFLKGIGAEARIDRWRAAVCEKLQEI